MVSSRLLTAVLVCQIVLVLSYTFYGKSLQPVQNLEIPKNITVENKIIENRTRTHEEPKINRTQLPREETKPADNLYSIYGPAKNVYLEEYVRVHSKPTKDSKFLVYSRKFGGGGLGSTMWGMSHACLLAVLTNRTFVIRYNDPAPLEHIFGTNIIDWRYSTYAHIIDRIPSQNTIKIDNSDVMFDIPNDVENDYFQNKQVVFATGFNMENYPNLWSIPQFRWILLQHFGWDASYHHSWTNNGVYDTLAALMMRLLFKMPDTMTKTFNEYEDLRKNTIRVGMQIRTGDVVNRPDKIRDRGDKLDWFWTCFQEFMYDHLNSNVSLFFTSDTPAMYAVASNKSKEMGFHLITVSGTHGVHTDARNVGVPAWITSGLEYHLLGNSDILMCSYSSFCNTASHLYRKRPMIIGLACGNRKSDGQKWFERPR